MDSLNQPESVIKCQLCETPVLLKHCYIFHMHPYAKQIGENLSDESKKQCIVPASMKKCKGSSRKIRKLQYKQDYGRICTSCVFSLKSKHYQNKQGHILIFLERLMIQMIHNENFIHITLKYKNEPNPYALNKEEIRKLRQMLNLLENRERSELPAKVQDILTYSEGLEVNNLPILCHRPSILYTSVFYNSAECIWSSVSNFQDIVCDDTKLYTSALWLRTCPFTAQQMVSDELAFSNKYFYILQSNCFSARCKTNKQTPVGNQMQISNLCAQGIYIFIAVSFHLILVDTAMAKCSLGWAGGISSQLTGFSF